MQQSPLGCAGWYLWMLLCQYAFGVKWLFSITLQKHWGSHSLIYSLCTGLSNSRIIKVPVCINLMKPMLSDGRVTYLTQPSLYLVVYSPITPTSANDKFTKFHNRKLPGTCALIVQTPCKAAVHGPHPIAFRLRFSTSTIILKIPHGEFIATWFYALALPRLESIRHMSIPFWTYQWWFSSRKNSLSFSSVSMISHLWIHFHACVKISAINATKTRIWPRGGWVAIIATIHFIPKKDTPFSLPLFAHGYSCYLISRI